jgi:hypothetical protein
MGIIGQVESVWRYPVKSMRGEAMVEIFAGFSGVYGDRLYAFKSSAAPVGFPYFTGRERHETLLYRPRFRHPERAALPPNLAEAEALSPILNHIGADPADLALDVETPWGEVLAIVWPQLRGPRRPCLRTDVDGSRCRAGRDGQPADRRRLTLCLIATQLVASTTPERSVASRPVWDGAPFRSPDTAAF